MLKKKVQEEQKDARNLGLLRFELKIPGVSAERLLPKDSEYRVSLHHKQKHQLENVNFHVNPLRVEMRNFDKSLLEEHVLVCLWSFLVQQNQKQVVFRAELTQELLRGSLVSTSFVNVSKWSDLLDFEIAKQQKRISTQQLALISKALHITGIRMPRQENKCFEILRNFAEVRKLRGDQLTGVCYFDLENVEAGKFLIKLLDN